AKQPTWFRWLGPYFLIDQMFAMASFRLDDSPDAFRPYYMACALAFWSLWQVTVALGLVPGRIVPRAVVARVRGSAAVRRAAGGGPGFGPVGDRRGRGWVRDLAHARAAQPAGHHRR